ncbi:hypothetical protein RB595_009758 [Gaeumannomyces hyphopodioides]
MASVAPEDDHQAAYIFAPSDGRGPEGAAFVTPAAARPTKKRKLVASGSKSRSAVRGQAAPSAGSRRNQRRSATAASFVPLLGGAELPACVRARADLFDLVWARTDAAIQRVLREANASTLEGVCSFVKQADAQRSKIPAAFIVTGPDLSSQDLLFSQLGERLAEAEPSRFVRVSSAEATNLKSALKKIIRDVTCRPSDATPGEHLEDLAPPAGGPATRRKYLDYDLEALHVFLRAKGSRRVFVAFEDSEALDSSLLSDLIALFASWRDRIHFTLLFRIGTSVELFQARLPRSTYQHLHGCQFDVTHASAITDKILRAYLGHADYGPVLGPDFLATQLARQREQVAGIQMLISSIKFAYMCHFYANPLSFLSARDEPVSGWQELMQGEHFDAVRHLASFRAEVESCIEIGRRLDHARALLEDDNYLSRAIQGQMIHRRKWAQKLGLSLELLVDSGAASTSFTSLYTYAVSEGLDLSAKAVGVVDGIRRMQASHLAAVVEKMISLIGLETREDDASSISDRSRIAKDMSDRLGSVLAVVLDSIRSLQQKVEANGTSLRSKYHTQSRVLRTTVVAQKVQLSRDTAALSEDDKAFSKLVDTLIDALTENLVCEAPEEVFLHEAWLYDHESPHRDIFVPAPGAALERALARPHDYLACSCCSSTPAGGLASTLPATSILYHLYKEAGPLVNVADLWTAFSAMVAADESAAGEDDGSGDGKRGAAEGCDERTALVLFYRGLAELRSMGFVQPTRKKEDHIAKVKWM